MKREVFGELADYARQQPCIACGAWPSEPHHVKTRGAGGDDVRGFGGHGNIAPLCAKHHRAVHARGRKTFEREHGLDLPSAAEQLYRRWAG